MLQLSQVLLPVDHTDASLRKAALEVLRTREADVKSLTIKQRAIDARRGHVSFSYTLLAEVADEARVLQKLDRAARVQVATQEDYNVAHGIHEV